MPPTDAPTLTDSTASSWDALRARVDAVRNKQRLKFLGTGLLAGIAIFVAAFLGFSAADILFKLSVSSRIVALASTLIAIVFAFYFWLFKPIQKIGGTVQAAREVESAFPELEQQLSTALEFGGDPAKARAFASPALVNALVSQAGTRAEPLDFARTIRWKQLALAFAAAFVLALFMGAYAARNSRLFAATWSRFIKPAADFPAPTLTEIKKVEPGDGKYALETSVPVTVALEGQLPDTATLSVLVGSEKDSHWEDRPMDRGEDGLYRATLRRLLDNARYKIRAGDAESREYAIKVFKTPEISEFSLRLEHPAYTGKGIESLPPNTGDIRALKGSKIHIDLKSNVELGAATASFKSRRTEIRADADKDDKRKASLVFDIDKDDEYQIKIADTDGNPGSGALFQIKALRDRFPRVTIKKPEKDLMVFKEQSIDLEVSADDDIGVKEIGIFHSIGLEEKQILIKRLDPQPLRADGKLVWDLAKMELKGGEVITYYAYALDNDTVNSGGPKMSKSDIHFLTVYDEEKYDQEKNPEKKKNPGTPPEIKQLDKLIDIQKKILKETFAQARQKDSLRDKDDAEKTKSAQDEKVTAAKTAEAQKQLRDKVEDLIDKVKTELAKGDDPAADPHADGEPKQKPAIGEKELKNLETATARMKGAETELKRPDTPAAVKPENEALRHLSEVRRLLLSDKEGDPRIKMAMNKNAKNNKKKEQDQEQKDQQDAKQELSQMPKMLEREKEIERNLEELTERKRKPPQGEPQSEERKQQEETTRQLEQKVAEDLKQLAKEAEDRARKLEQLSERNSDIKPAADKIKDAADKLAEAKKDAEKGQPKNNQDAQNKTAQAQQSTREAQRSLRDLQQKQIRQELAETKKDADELAQRQQDLAQQMQNEQKQQEQGQPKDGAQSQKSEQAKNGEPQKGEKPQKGEQAQAGEPQLNGQPQQSSSGSQESKEMQAQRMRSMAGKQRDIQSDLKDLNERVKSLAEKAGDEKLAGSKDLDQARKQSGESSAASQAAEKAGEALSSAKPEEARREAANAAKALQQLAATMTDAKQKTEAGDMKALSSAMKKLQELAKEQSDIGKDLGDKKDLQPLIGKQEKVGEATKALADAAAKLETLRQSGTQDTAKPRLEKAVSMADESVKQMQERNASAAKAASDQTEKSLAQALADMERAAGKTLEDKAREARTIAKEAYEQQEKANGAIKEVSDKQGDQKLSASEASKRDEAVAREQQAAREARRLDQALEGLKELAQDANPAAAEAANEARDETQKSELPKAMDNLANDMQRLGTDQKPPDANSAKSPSQAAKKGVELAKTLKNVDKQLDAYVAEARNSLEERLKTMEELANQAAKTAQALSDNQSQKSDEKNPAPAKQPNASQIGEPSNDPNQAKIDDLNKADPKRNSGRKNESAMLNQPNAKPSDLPTDEASLKELLNKQLKKLQPKLERLEAKSPESIKMKEALAALERGDDKNENSSEQPKGPPQPGNKNMGGTAFKRVSKAMESVAQGIMERRERLLRARDIRPDEDEDAPKEYRVLVDKYYRALSEDVEQK